MKFRTILHGRYHIVQLDESIEMASKLLMGCRLGV